MIKAKLTQNSMGLLMAILFMLLSIFIISKEYRSSPKASLYDANEDLNSILTQWYDLIIDLETVTEGYRFPVVARAYAYIGLAGYESVLPVFTGQFHTLSAQNQFTIPTIDHPDDLHPGLVLNACYARIISHFFETVNTSMKTRILELEHRWEKKLSNDTESQVYTSSIEFGRAVAESIYSWSKQDSLGHQSYLHNYDRNYQFEESEGKWQPASYNPMPAMLPYWGKLRPIVIDVDSFIARPLPPYSSAANSIYYQQAMEIYALHSPLTYENRIIALYWNDDYRGLTFGHPSHWVSIALQVLNKEKPYYTQSLELMLKLGISMFDSSIACWNSKYLYNLERPEQFINNHISPIWRPLEPSPSHPGYPSGHSSFGAAAAYTLTAFFGPEYKMVDNSHKRNNLFKFKPRKFNSFKEMSLENSMSRVLLGVHFRMDCEEGRRLGKSIARKVNSIPIHKLDTQLSYEY